VSALVDCLFERASPGAPKNIYFVSGPLESGKVIANVRKCRKIFETLTSRGIFQKFFWDLIWIQRVLMHHIGRFLT